MARASKVSSMPDEVRVWLEKALIDRKFSGYQELEDLMREKGIDISRGSIHRFGQKLERRLNAIKDSTEAAQLIAAAAPDEADNRSAAVMALIQTQLFNAMVDLQELEETKDPEKRLKILNGVSISFSMLAKSSLAQKKRDDEIKAKFAALEAKAQAQQGKKKGLDLETIKMIRETIYGV